MDISTCQCNAHGTLDHFFLRLIHIQSELAAKDPDDVKEWVSNEGKYHAVLPAWAASG
jgi:hypothetical protein